jgi:hypothetical protein
MYCELFNLQFAKTGYGQQVTLHDDKPKDLETELCLCIKQAQLIEAKVYSPEDTVVIITTLDRLAISVQVYGVAVTKQRVLATIATLVGSVIVRYVASALAS